MKPAHWGLVLVGVAAGAMLWLRNAPQDAPPEGTSAAVTIDAASPSQDRQTAEPLVEPEIADTHPTEVQPTEEPADPFDPEPEVADVQPTDVPPTETQPTETQPSEPKPSEPKPSEPKPSEPNSAVASPDAAQAAEAREPAEAADTDEPSQGAQQGVRTVLIKAYPAGARIGYQGKQLGIDSVEVQVEEGKRMALEIGYDGHNTRRLVVDGTKPEVTVVLNPKTAR